VRLLNTSAESETRILSRIGGLAVLLIAIAAGVYFIDPFAHPPRDVVSVAIETPYVGQGVAVGTPVIMHGVKIGQVTSVSSIPGSGVRLKTDFQRRYTRGLTDAMGIDYRPSNYFGVTGINVIPAQSGRPLESGMQISLMPKGNFSLQALLYRLGEVANGVLNQRLISVIERATRYADGLNPLLETVLMIGNSVATVQTVSTERLLRNTAGVSVAFPGFVDGAISAGNEYIHTDLTDLNPKRFDEIKKTWNAYPVLGAELMKRMDATSKFLQKEKNSEKFWSDIFIPVFDAARTDLFGRVGYLEGSHVNDLFPLLESIRGLADTVPKIVLPENFAYTVTELRTRLERMYAGSGEQRALQVRIVLDRLPGVAAPLGQMGG
jgi:MlaD protein